MKDSLASTGNSRSFVILSSQRSGSTFVRIWLNQHSQIHSYGEVFLGHYYPQDGFRAFCAQKYASKFLFQLQHAWLNKYSRLNFLPQELVVNYLNVLCRGKDHPSPWTDINNRVNNSQSREWRPVVGFKLMYNTLAQYPALQRWLMESRPRVIHMVRNNLLRSYVSMVRMNVSRIDHSKTALPARNKIPIDVDKFIDFAEKQILLAEEFRWKMKGNVPYLELSYENYFGDTSGSKNALLNFLEVGDEDMPFHNMKKIGSTNLGDDIENWEEVSSRLLNTEYATFLTQHD